MSPSGAITNRSTLWGAVSVLLVVLGACATPAANGSPVGSSDVITRVEIDERGAANAFELVQSLRPQWLRTRGISTLQQAVGEETIVIYMDNARLGPPDAMRQIALGSVRYLQFFDAREATQRWGAGHLHGAILVSTQER